ncbi:MAG: toxin [Planctomycetes bacterium]|nr:toxin [Planctomycetota bacterium]
MKHFDWNTDKNDELRSDRNVTFEEIVFSVMRGGLLDIIEHPNTKKYPNQRIFIVDIDDYAYLVPFVETEERVFLKTIIPSRKMTKMYLGGDKRETQ